MAEGPFFVLVNDKTRKRDPFGALNEVSNLPCCLELDRIEGRGLSTAIADMNMMP